MSTTLKRGIAAVAVVIVLGALAYPKVRPLFSSDEESPSEISRGEATVQAEAFVVKPDTVKDKIFTTGTLIANEQIELRSEVSGLITDIYLQEGQRVAKGKLLIKVNDSELKAEFKRAEYRLGLAKELESRQKKLLEKGGISQEEYDATLNEVNVLQAETDLIKARIAKTEIRAPFAGQIGLKYVSDGDYISPSTRIATLQSIDPIKIDFSIPERYATRVQDGDTITFTVEGGDREFEGTIYAIEPKIESETRTLQIRARSNNSNRMLVPGGFANLELTLETIFDAKMIPTIALVPELEGQKVYLYKDGKVVPQSVKTGIRTDQKVQILEGVQLGDTLLTTGLLQVRPGMKVHLQTVE